MQEKKPAGRFNNISFMKAFAYVSSTAVMIVSFVFIGYMIGVNWGTLGAGIGVTIGGLLGLFTIFSELYGFVKSESGKDEGSSEMNDEPESQENKNKEGKR